MGMFGGGVYFADRTTKSARYSGTQRPGQSGQLLLCRVTLGNPLLLYTPRQNLRRPPDPSPLWPSQLHLWLKGGKYHSIFAPASPLLVMNEYIVYHTNQAYPEYLVDYTLV